MSDCNDHKFLSLKTNDYSEFKELAKSASFVTYKPKFYTNPFKDEPERMHSVYLQAHGVKMKGIQMNITFNRSCELTLDTNSLSSDESIIAEISNEILCKFINQIKSELNAVESGGFQRNIEDVWKTFYPR